MSYLELCADITGVLWAGMSEHFFNNFIGNFLHVVSDGEINELQILRIVISKPITRSKGRREGTVFVCEIHAGIVLMGLYI